MTLLAWQTIDWSGAHVATEVMRLACISVGVAILALAIPVGRRYYHPIFVPVMVFTVLWDVSSTFTEIGRLGTQMTWRIWFNLAAESVALAWMIFLLWRFKRYGKIDTGRVRNYYRGLRRGHDPSVEGLSEGSKDS